MAAVVAVAVAVVAAEPVARIQAGSSHLAQRKLGK